MTKRNQATPQADSNKRFDKLLQMMGALRRAVGWKRQPEQITSQTVQ